MQVPQPNHRVSSGFEPWPQEWEASGISTMPIHSGYRESFLSVFSSSSLYEGAVSAVDIVRQLADLVVDLAVVEEESVVAELGHELAALADVVQVALLGVAELAVGLGAAEVELGAGEVQLVLLGGAGADQEDEDDALHGDGFRQRLTDGISGGAATAAATADAEF